MRSKLPDDLNHFLSDKHYLQNISQQTTAIYEASFKAFQGAMEPDQLKARVVALREQGLSPVSVNTYLRHIKAYYRWRKLPWELPWLKEEQKILATFSPEQVRKIVGWKPPGQNGQRIWTMSLVALDAGPRLAEILALKRQDIDLDNLLLKLQGKGNKQRLVPISIELRRVLYKYLSRHESQRVFITRTGTAFHKRNALRAFKWMCRSLKVEGVRCSFHTLRHTFAVSYLRAGGNLYYLQRILGHASITTTERYLRSLGIEDLQKVHNGLSLLSKVW